MKLRSLVVAVAAFAMAGGALAQDVSSEKGKLSYYFGYDYGNNLAELTADETDDLAAAYAQRPPVDGMHRFGGNVGAERAGDARSDVQRNAEAFADLPQFQQR